MLRRQKVARIAVHNHLSCWGYLVRRGVAEQLDVRRVKVRVRPHKAADLIDRHRKRSAPRHHIPRPGSHTPKGVAKDVIQRLLRGAELVGHSQMVLQSLPHLRQVMAHCDPLRLQQLRWPDAGQLQKLRRIDGARA